MKQLLLTAFLSAIIAVLVNSPAVPKQVTFCNLTGGTDIVDSNGIAFGCARYVKEVK